MKVEDVYQFFFHPWSDEHSFETQIAATITDIALSILSGGLFLIPFLYFQWKDRDVKQMHNATAATKVASEILKSPNPPPVVRSTNTHLSSKARTVKEKQAWQLNQFEQWAASGQWSKIHNAHYDWWMYPIDQPSRGHGTTYQLNSREITELKADPEFMANYIRGVVLGAQAWGWDVLNVKQLTIQHLTRNGKIGTSVSAKWQTLSDSSAKKNLEQACVNTFRKTIFCSRIGYTPL